MSDYTPEISHDDHQASFMSTFIKRLADNVENPEAASGSFLAIDSAPAKDLTTGKSDT